jgi:DNA helicase II / ATP-dependent DNA helicase PcrA
MLLLADLNAAQREAVLAVRGPVAILSGAGSGKTRVVSRRAAYAIATGVVPADQVLLVTFTDKAAREMVERLAALGLPGVTARTFHAHALTQLRHFWPSHHDGAGLPEILDSKLPILGRLAASSPAPTGTSSRRTWRTRSNGQRAAGSRRAASSARRGTPRLRCPPT